jgi:gluconate 2-dehydrogenase gamma chain
MIPEDDFPSATQAGVLNYIDRKLSRRFRQHRAAYREGLAAVDELSRRRFNRDFAWLSPQQQSATLSEFKRLYRKYFDLFHSHTVEGYYGQPQ